MPLQFLLSVKKNVIYIMSMKKIWINNKRNKKKQNKTV